MRKSTSVKLITIPAALFTLLTGCVQYKDELARFMEPEARAASTTEKKTDDSKDEIQKESLDMADDVSFYNIKNKEWMPLSEDAAFNMLAYGSGKIDDEGNTAIAQAKAMLKTGDWRFAVYGQDLYQHDRADPEDHENKDLYANLARVLGGLGKHFATKNKDFMVYIEAIGGYEHTDFGGPLDLEAGAAILGGKAGIYSKSTDTLILASILAGKNKHKGTIGVNDILVEGEYERATGTVHVLQGLGKRYFVFAKAGADLKDFENFAKYNTYLVSGGLEKRFDVAKLPTSLSLKLYGQYGIKDYIGSAAEDSRKFGTKLEYRMDLGRGIYASAYLQHEREWDRGSFRGEGEWEGGLSLTAVLGDLLGSRKKK